jgi:hypothetical protein
VTPIAMPPTHAALAAVSSPEKPRTQGEMNSNTAQTTLIQSWTFFRASAQKFPEPPTLHAALNNAFDFHS